MADLTHDQGTQLLVPTTGDQEVNLTELTPEEAQERVAPEGYFGVEKTSGQIFQFTVGVAGQDLTRIDAVKEASNRDFRRL
ncbi:hypothetical protein [Desulfolithobacter sp.]